MFRNSPKNRPEQKRLVVAQLRLVLTFRHYETSPEALVRWLCECHDVIQTAIESHHGRIESAQAENIRATWDAPLDAVKSIVRCKEGIAQLSQRFELGDIPGLRFRACIHCGWIIVGKLGGRGKQTYSILGEPLNELNRFGNVVSSYGTAIAASDAVVLELNNDLVTRELDLTLVKGTSAPLSIYEVLGWTGFVSEDQQRGYAEFERGLRSYFKFNWKGAEAGFQACMDLIPDDRPSRIYLERVAHMRANPPPSEVTSDPESWRSLCYFQSIRELVRDTG